MKAYTDIDDVLKKTNNGEMTIVPENQLDIERIRANNFEIFSKLVVLSYKPKKGIHMSFIQAKDIDTYIVLTRIVKKYKVLGAKGHLLAPAVPMAA